MVVSFFQVFFYNNGTLDLLREKINFLVKKFTPQENFQNCSGKKERKRKPGEFVAHL